MSRKREEKIQSADFHTYANIQKAMCIKNPATAGGEIFLWRIYKRNRFRELFLVGTDSTPTPFVKIQQLLLFWWFYITSALWTGCDDMLKSLWKFETTYKLRYKFLSMVPGQQAIFKGSPDMSIHGHLVCDCLYKDFSVQIRRYTNIKISLSEQAS